MLLLFTIKVIQINTRAVHQYTRVRVNTLNVGRKVVIVIEFTPIRAIERGKEQDPKVGFVLGYLSSK